MYNAIYNVITLIDDSQSSYRL